MKFKLKGEREIPFHVKTKRIGNIFGRFSRHVTKIHVIDTKNYEKYRSISPIVVEYSTEGAKRGVTT